MGLLKSKDQAEALGFALAFTLAFPLGAALLFALTLASAFGTGMALQRDSSVKDSWALRYMSRHPSMSWYLHCISSKQD